MSLPEALFDLSTSDRWIKSWVFVSEIRSRDPQVKESEIHSTLNRMVTEGKLRQQKADFSIYDSQRSVYEYQRSS